MQPSQEFSSIRSRTVTTHHPPAPNERSNGWEAVAADFLKYVRHSTMGVETIRAWSASLPAGTAVLDLACGPGTPRSEVLSSAGFDLYGVDASPTLAAAYQSHFPAAHVACEAVEDSTFFGRTFDAALAWGLLFLLAEDTQRAVIERVARALNPGGRFLFTAPSQVHKWADLSTGRESVSLGAKAYEAAIGAAGLVLLATHTDEGDNHYYDTAKR